MGVVRGTGVSSLVRILQQPSGLLFRRAAMSLAFSGCAFLPLSLSPYHAFHPVDEGSGDQTAITPMDEGSGDPSEGM